MAPDLYFVFLTGGDPHHMDHSEKSIQILKKFKKHSDIYFFLCYHAFIKLYLQV